MTETQKATLYTWSDLPREEVRHGVTRSGFRGDQVMLVMNWLEPGMDVKPHKHAFEQIAYIISGWVHFHIGNDVMEAGPGSVVRIPPGVMHYAEPVGEEPAMNLDVFSPIREDYRHLVEYQREDFGE